MITLDGLAGAKGIRHGFFTREGGVSRGIYASLNCGFGSRDERMAVAENRARAMAALGRADDSLATPHQVHGVTVACVDRPWEPGRGPKADAVVTTVPGITLGILVADCAPLLFADDAARVVGAAHAGWRGALAGVAESTIAAMEALGARRERIVAGIGPCIGTGSYEVGPEFPAPFLEREPADARFFRPASRSGHHLFDLEGYLLERLRVLGLGVVESCAVDTCANPDRFFSYRRACLEGEPDYARQLAAIGLVDQ